ncbi:MAG: helix-turn-helix domain-containing protein [Planctomycetota bacterium]
MSDFADFLKEARERAGLTQTELAEKAGLTGSYISILESRKKPPPSDPVLKRLARALRVAESKLLEVAHLDRSPEDIRKKIRALDRHLRLEKRLTRKLLTDILPSSLWHFWRVRGFQEYGLEKVRLDGKRLRILKKVLRRIGHLTSREDFVEESRLVIQSLPVEERSVLAEVLPELVLDAPEEERSETPPPTRDVPVLAEPPGPGRRSARKVLEALPVAAPDDRPAAYFLRAPDADMAPRVEEGDLLLVDPESEPEPGSVAVVTVEGRTTVRQVLAGKKGPLLVALNPKVPPREGKRSDLLGVIVEIRRRL